MDNFQLSQVPGLLLSNASDSDTLLLSGADALLSGNGNRMLARTELVLSPRALDILNRIEWLSALLVNFE